MKVCIIYGWSEGPWQGKLLRTALHKSGFSITRRAQEADIIIAHSGGCYMLPDNSRAQLVLLVGLPYWRGKHPVRSLQEKLRSELRDMWWYKKTIFNTYYFFTRPRRWVRMWQNWSKQVLPQLDNVAVTLVRNEQDYFMHPTDSKSLADKHNWKMKTLQGLHDDIWNNPQPYVELIKDSLSN